MQIQLVFIVCRVVVVCTSESEKKKYRMANVQSIIDIVRAAVPSIHLYQCVVTPKSLSNLYVLTSSAVNRNRIQ